MKTSHLFFASAAVTAVLGSGAMVDANKPVVPADSLPRMTLDLGDCVVSAEIKDLGSEVELCFRASNPGSESCSAEFNYTLDRRSPTSPMSRMMVMPKRVKQDRVCWTAQPGESELGTIRIAKPDWAGGATQKTPGVAKLLAMMTPGSWQLKAQVAGDPSDGQEQAGTSQVVGGAGTLLAVLQDPVPPTAAVVTQTTATPQAL
jgi:hypothetical protein